MRDAAEGPQLNDGVEAVHDAEEGSSTKGGLKGAVEGPVPDARLAEGVAGGDLEAAVAEVVGGENGLSRAEAVACDGDPLTAKAPKAALDPAGQRPVAREEATADPAAGASRERHQPTTHDVLRDAAPVRGASEAHHALPSNPAHQRSTGPCTYAVKMLHPRRFPTAVQGPTDLSVLSDAATLQQICGAFQDCLLFGDELLL